MATFTQLGSGNWRVQVRRKNRYVAETFRRRKDGEEWALEMERNIDRNGSSKPRAVRDVRTFGDLIDLHDEDMREVGKPPRRSKAAVMASLKAALGHEPSRAIAQKLTMTVPFLSDFLLSEDRNCDLSVGLAFQALVERDQSLVQALVGSKGRFLNRSKVRVGEALQAP